MHHPFVSVIVPVYNGEKTIAECIESLLKQDYPKDRYEIIIVDNNSKDRTAEIIKKYPVKYILEDKIQSSYGARNKGVKATTGEILAFTDSDCITTSGWLKNGVMEFTKDKQLGCVGGRTEAYQTKTIVQKCLQQREGARGFVTSYFLPFFPTMNVFYRRGVFEEVGFFDVNMYSGGDADFCWKMQLETNFSVKYVPDALIYHNERPSAKGLFKQRKWYGWSSVNLSKRYNKMPEKTISHIYRSFHNLFDKLIILIKLRIEALIYRKPRTYWYSAYIDVVIDVAAKLGQAQALIQHKIQSLRERCQKQVS